MGRMQNVHPVVQTPDFKNINNFSLTITPWDRVAKLLMNL